jgi:hypothetical protein
MLKSIIMFMTGFDEPNLAEIAARQLKDALDSGNTVDLLEALETAGRAVREVY